jgi:GNAT superfamily N-acetyltransferase
MTAFLAGLRDGVRAVGWLRAPLVLAAWAVRVRYEIYVCCEGDVPAATDAALPAGLRREPVTEGNLELAAALHPAAGRDEMRRRLADGHVGTLVRDGDDPIHVSWDFYGVHRLPFLGLTLEMVREDHHRGGSHTRHDRRGRGLHAALIAASVAEARRRGARRSLGFVASWNEPARRAVVRAGWRGPVGAVWCWRFGPLRRYSASGAARLLPGRRLGLDPA